MTAEKQNGKRKSKMGVAPVAEGAIIEYVKGQRKSKYLRISLIDQSADIA